MKVLVIYELIPEGTNKAIVEMDETEYAFFRQSEGSFINVGDYDEATEEVNMVVSNAFSSEPDNIKYCDTDKQREYFGRFKHDGAIEDLTDVDRMIHCGFLL